MEKTTVYLPPRLRAALKSSAHRTKRSEAEIVREALASYLAAEPFLTVLPRSFGMISDGSYDASEDETFLEDHWKRASDGLQTM